jgi:hypothetical protein
MKNKMWVNPLFSPRKLKSIKNLDEIIVDDFGKIDH